MDRAVLSSFVVKLSGAPVRALKGAQVEAVYPLLLNYSVAVVIATLVCGVVGGGVLCGNRFHRILLYVGYEILPCRRCSVRKSGRRRLLPRLYVAVSVKVGLTTFVSGIAEGAGPSVPTASSRRLSHTLVGYAGCHIRLSDGLWPRLSRPRLHFR